MRNLPSQRLSFLNSLMKMESEKDYVCERELTLPNVTLPMYWIKKGVNGLYYAVFEDSYSAFEFDLLVPDAFKDCPLSAFGWPDNAFELGRLH